MKKNFLFSAALVFMASIAIAQETKTEENRKPGHYNENSLMNKQRLKTFCRKRVSELQNNY